MPTEAHVGRPLSRVDGVAKVTGRATFVAEIGLPGLAHAVLVGSAISAGRITTIDTATAMAAPGVLAVLTHRDFPKLAEARVALKVSGRRDSLAGSAGQQRLPMQDDRVTYAGEPVAVVVADTFERATFAAALVRVSYAADRPKVDLQAERHAAFKPTNVWGDDTDSIRGDPVAAHRDAPITVVRTYVTPVMHHVTMEPHATTAHWQGEQLTVYEPSTWVYGVRQAVATWFGLKPEQVRAVQHYVGGSFGCKGPTWPHVAITVAAARHVGRPVRLVITRPQSFTSNGYRPQMIHDVKLAATADGKLTAMTYDTTAQTAVFDDRVAAPTIRTPRRLYAMANLSTSYRLVGLNRSGPFTFRGPGETPGLFAIECAMDELAAELGIDPLELRLRNHADVDPEANQPWSSKHLRECYRQAADRFNWAGRDPTPRARRDGDHWVGTGMATMMYDARSSAANASVTLDAAGRVAVRSATCDQGTGSRTILTQMAADALGVRPEHITVEVGDTALPMAPISAGSMTTASVGTAVTAAAADLRTKLVLTAVSHERSPLRGRPVDTVQLTNGRAVAGEASVALSSLAQWVGQPLVGTGASAKIGEAEGVSRFSFGAHFAEVRVNAVTGEVRVSRYAAAFAAGRIVNPKLARSQLLGGIVMGIGMALHEATHIDPETGRIVNDDLAEYHVPTHADIAPVFDAFFVPEDDDCAVNPIGVKGVGEIGTIGCPAAVANAVWHATGRRVRDLPITPDKLL